MTSQPADSRPEASAPGPADPARPPLSAAQLAGALAVPGGLWTAVRVVAQTGSSNLDVAEAARAGTAEGLVLVAEHQHAGRGRAGRSWSSPPRAGLTVSGLLRPGAGGSAVPPTQWGWLPLLAGVALVEAVTTVAAVPAALKWPNDLLVEGRKAAGVLAEVVGDAVVLGIGVNVTNLADELPAAPDGWPATSLLLAGARSTDRAALLRELLGRLAHWYDRWRTASGDSERCGLARAYRRVCATLGQPVRVRLPDGGQLTGRASDIDPAGRLILATAAGARTLAAGDIDHLRPARRAHPG